MNMLHEICQEKTLTMTKKLSKNTKTTKPAGFTVDEAFSLLERCVVKKPTKQSRTLPQAMNIGVISGLLTINKEVELVIKFLDHVQQYTKAEFARQINLVEPSD